MRPDFIPIEYANEFEKLKDTVQPFDFEDLESLIRTELWAPIDEIFREFRHEPIAAASIGQVHREK